MAISETNVNIEQLLLDAANGQVSDDRLSSVCDFFGEDIDRQRLNSQLLLLPELCIRQSVTDIGELKSHLVDLGLSLYMFSEVKTLLKLFYVIPGSSATAERSFSVMRRIKNYLRTTMTSQRLNSVMLLHVHRELADTLDMNILVNDFVTGSSNRKEIFGNTLYRCWLIQCFFYNRDRLTVVSVHFECECCARLFICRFKVLLA